jgi:hypothetical protein
MLVRLSSASTPGKPTWVSTEYVQAIIGSPHGGSRIKLMDGWVDVSEEPDDVVRLAEKAHE